MPAGGLFSTATDLSIFYRMIYGGGVFAGKRYLSEEAVNQMTSKQTGDLPTPYGFGFSTGGDNIGHGGAYSTNSSLNKKRKIITIFLVQHAGFPKGGEKAQGIFQKAATDAFGK